MPLQPRSSSLLAAGGLIAVSPGCAWYGSPPPWSSASPTDTGPSGDTGPALVDADGDGDASEASGGDDCDDADPTVYPGAPEDGHGEIDSDCDGVAHLCELAEADVVFSGAIRTGEWVELLDDIDGDGQAEVLVGAYISQQGGGSHIVLSSSLGSGGSFSLEEDADCTVLDDLGKDEELGRPFIPARAGDVNGRGAPDLAFGYPDDRWDGGSWVSVFFGEWTECRARLWTDSEAGVQLVSWSSTAAGEQIASGDVNGDGLADLATDGNIPLDAVYVFGAADLTAGATLTEADASAVLVGSAKDGPAGIPREAGDTNGDGYNDLLMLARADSIDAVALWYGDAALLSGTLPMSDAGVLFVEGPSTDGARGVPQLGAV